MVLLFPIELGWRKCTIRLIVRSCSRLIYMVRITSAHKVFHFRSVHLTIFITVCLNNKIDRLGLANPSSVSVSSPAYSVHAVLMDQNRPHCVYSCKHSRSLASFPWPRIFYTSQLQSMDMDRRLPHSTFFHGHARYVTPCLVLFHICISDILTVIRTCCYACKCSLWRETRVKNFLWAIWFIYAIFTLGLVGVGLWIGHGMFQSTTKFHFYVCVVRDSTIVCLS